MLTVWVKGIQIQFAFYIINPTQNKLHGLYLAGQRSLKIISTQISKRVSLLDITSKNTSL
jgi:hypothetical protein